MAALTLPRRDFDMTVSAPTWRPFARLNLSVNPFGELAPQQRAEAAVVDVQSWKAWLAQSPADGRLRAAQFMGDRGRGKTTHLLALRYAMPGAHYVHLPQHGPLPPVPEGPLVMIDEAQRLPWRLRRQVFSRGHAQQTTFVLGTHNDLRRSLRRAGYQVQTLTVAGLTDAAQVAKIMNVRIELARADAGPVPRLSLADAEALIARFGDDVRAMEGYLYERLQGYAGSEHHAEEHYGEVRFID